VLLQRVGRERLMTEAVESHIGGWFWNAAARSRVRPVAQPEYDFELPASDDEDWEFTATVAVQAKPELPDWKQLEVGVAEVEVPEELVQQELDALRATVAELVPVAGRPVGPDDTLVVDLVAEEETRRDYVVDLGRGAVVEEVEQGLVGMSAGDTKEMSFELADGSTQTLTATVKEIKEKVLPPLDDDLARAATEFETFAELRADIESRLREQIEDEVETRFRADVADALVAASKVEAAGPLVESRTRELLRGFARQVEARGVPLETFLAMTGQQPEELVAQLQGESGASSCSTRSPSSSGSTCRMPTSRSSSASRPRRSVTTPTRCSWRCARAVASSRSAKTSGSATRSTTSPARSSAYRSRRPRPARRSGRPTRRIPRPRRNSGPPTSSPPTSSTAKEPDHEPAVSADESRHPVRHRADLAR